MGRIAGNLIGLALLCFLVQSSWADSLADYQTQVGSALHLLETGRYGEAEDAAQALIAAYPEAALPYEVRGATALYVGSTSRAQADFLRAELLQKDPATEYGLTLCALSGQKLDTANEALTQIRQFPALTGPQANDLDTLEAYERYLRGDAAGAQALAGKNSSTVDPLRMEILALAAYRLDAKAGAPLLAKFLETANGVPSVREADGLRPLFDSARPIEPCVIEPELQQMYADRLTGSITEAARHAGEIPICSGKTTLTAPTILPAGTTLVSFSVDDRIAAMVNQRPYTFQWNTAHVANGMHTIRIEAEDNNGNTLSSQLQTLLVRNKSSDTALPTGGSDPATLALTARLWNLLRLRPCRKVAEWTLAQAALASGDRISANAHLLNAAALDPAYKDGRRFARALFGSSPTTITHSVAMKPISLWHGNSSRKEIALTFDDGPNPAKTPGLLDALDKAQAPATFFVVGSRAELTPDILRRMSERGDEVENHSYTHPNMNLVIPSVAESEILRTSVLIRAMTGRQPHFFRPPGGNANLAVQQVSRAYGLTLAYWTVDALHAEDVGSSPELIQYVVSHVHPGSIVLLHNGTDVTTASVPALVAALRAQGYKLVTLAEIAQGAGGVRPTAAPKMQE